jgi:hypothetical protein
MKAKTYARISLLIPFLVWGVCLLYVLVTNAITPEQLDSFFSTPAVDWISRFIFYYVFGIIIWLLPYLLLFAILFGLTFSKQVNSLLYFFLLSPFAMAILVILENAAFLLILPDLSASTSTAASGMNYSIASFIAFGAISIVWGYICVGIGFGIYKLLQRFGLLQKERSLESNTLVNNLVYPS